MRPTPEELSDAGRYEKLLEFTHDDLVPVVQANLKRPGPVKAVYLVANAAVVAAIAFLWVRSGRPFFDTVPTLCLGMCLGYVLLLPVHEALHALAYRRFGAAGTRVVYTPRNLSAYCVADRFVAGGGEFVWVCLAPFLVLNSALLAMIALAGGFRPLLWGMLLLHVGACSGDFAFVSLAWAHRRDGLWTYDDVAGRRTFFYRTRSPAPAEPGQPV